MADSAASKSSSSDQPVRFEMQNGAGPVFIRESAVAGWYPGGRGGSVIIPHGREPHTTSQVLLIVFEDPDTVEQKFADEPVIDPFDRAYADTVGHAFHSGRCQSTRVEVAFDACGHSTSHISEVAEFRTMEKVEMISGTHEFQVTFAGYPSIHHRWTGDTALIVRTTEAKDL